MSNPTGCGSDGLPVADMVTSDGGSEVGTAKGDVPLGSQVSINGSTDLSQIIVGPDGAYVQSITYEHFDGIARNAAVYVYGRGPKGAFTGSLDLAFYTSDGEHTLSLTSSSLECHSDIFEERADITSISWAPSK
jgi:hypothetical protein